MVVLLLVGDHLKVVERAVLVEAGLYENILFVDDPPILLSKIAVSGPETFITQLPKRFHRSPGRRRHHHHVRQVSRKVLEILMELGFYL